MANIMASPSRYVQGAGELKKLCEHVKLLGSKLFVLTSPSGKGRVEADLAASAAAQGASLVYEAFHGECSMTEIERVKAAFEASGCDVVVGIGGGKIHDTAKAVADNYNAAVIIVPTTASTDAPAMGLSVIYTAAGEHVGARHYKKNPDLVLLDTDILAKAPVRFLVAGMGDALSTYPECRANVQSASPNYVNSGYHQTIACIAVSKACHETILTKGVSAKLAAEQGLCTKDVEDVIEANTLLSGLGVQNGSCAGAHSIAEGITVLEPCAKLLHGEVVAFGILVQLIVEGAPAEELDELYTFFEEVGLPTTFDDLGIPDATEADIRKVAETSMHSYWDVEPFAVNPQMVFDGIMMANTLGKRRKGL